MLYIQIDVSASIQIDVSACYVSACYEVI